MNNVVYAARTTTNPDAMISGYPNVLLDDRSRSDRAAIVNQRDFDRLMTYSDTDPTGVYPGKVWKRLRGRVQGRPRWWFCMFEEDEECPDTSCWLVTRELLLVED